MHGHSLYLFIRQSSDFISDVKKAAPIMSSSQKQKEGKKRKDQGKGRTSKSRSSRSRGTYNSVVTTAGAGTAEDPLVSSIPDQLKSFLRWVARRPIRLPSWWGCTVYHSRADEESSNPLKLIDHFHVGIENFTIESFWVSCWRSNHHLIILLRYYGTWTSPVPTTWPIHNTTKFGMAAYHNMISAIFKWRKTGNSQSAVVYVAVLFSATFSSSAFFICRVLFLMSHIVIPYSAMSGLAQVNRNIKAKNY